jgi:glyoxylase-like metal-dependent hydrolase (beta-lactamase superfamily II)
VLDDVRLLSSGFCVFPEAVARRGARWAPARFPAGFALLVHRQHGPVLFDTGYGHRFVDATRHLPNVLYALITPTTIPSADEAWHQLRTMGISESDVRTVVVSHFHADHIAGLRDFPLARIVCSQAGWTSVRRLDGIHALMKGFLNDLVPPNVEQRIQFVEELQTAPLPAAMGRLGDGSVLVVPLPGHATGQIGLFLPRSTRGPLFLVADAAWSPRAIATCTPPPRITTAVLGDTHTYRTTLARLNALQHTFPDLTVVPSHGPMEPRPTNLQ